LAPLFSELRAVTGGALVIVRGPGFINAFETPEFAAAVEQTGRRKLVMSGLLTEGCVLGTNHQTVQGFLGLMAQHSPAFGMLLQGQAARQAAPRIAKEL
jgi:hypothetical protein